jgi:glutathione peroxidase-family protein
LQENVEKVRNVFDCKEDIHWFDSGHVNGKETREVYSYLKREMPGDGKHPDIEWNYAKFLIASDGKPYKRFEHNIDLSELRDDIEHLLKLKEKEDAEIASARALKSTEDGTNSP